MLDQLIPPDQQPIVIAIAIAVALLTAGLYLLYRRLFETEEKEPESIAQGEAKVQIPKPAEKETVKVDSASQPTSEKKVAIAEATASKKDSSSAAATSAPPAKATKDLKEALGTTRNNLFGRIKTIFSSSQTMGEDELEELEEILYTSDIGPGTVQRLVESVSENMSHQEKSDFDFVRRALKMKCFRFLVKWMPMTQKISMR
ncbi:MAG: signal recognition particle receptor subunit alpha [Bdellovibrionales bacterium]